MLRQIAISSLTVAACAGTIVLHVAQAALADTVSCVPTGENRETCVLLDENNKPIGKPWTRSTAKSKSVDKVTKFVLLDMRVCTPDRDGGYNCTDSGSSLPPGTTINPRITIVPRSERDPKLPTVDTRRALLLDTELKPCRTNNPRKEGRCIIKTLAPVAVQDPSTSDGKNEPVYPGLPPAPRNTIASTFTPEPNDPPRGTGGTSTRLFQTTPSPTPSTCPGGVVLIDPDTNKPVCG